jgi:hypothetical protein
MIPRTLIARKRGHVIAEDQCVNTAFPMQGVSPLGTSAGARLTVICRAGSARPEAINAKRTRSRASDTAF